MKNEFIKALWRTCVLTLLVAASCFAQLPDAPQPQPGFLPYCQVYPASDLCPRAHFLTFRKSWQEPALRPSKKCWLIWAGAHGAAWAALALADRRKEAWHSEAPALAAVTGMDFLAFKFISPAMGTFPAAIPIVHYWSSR